MAWTAPSITASGITWAQFKKASIHQHIEAAIAANTGLTARQVQIIRSLEKGQVDLKVHGFENIVKNYLQGDPVANSDVNQQLLDYATAWAVLLQVANEAGTLITANAGTLTSSVNAAKTAVSTRRVLP